MEDLVEGPYVGAVVADDDTGAEPADAVGGHAPRATKLAQAEPQRSVDQPCQRTRGRQPGDPPPREDAPDGSDVAQAAGGAHGEEGDAASTGAAAE